MWYNVGMTATDLNLIIENLSAKEQKEVLSFVEKLLSERKKSELRLEKITAEKLLKCVRKSEREAACGKLRSYAKVRSRICDKYGISS